MKKSKIIVPALAMLVMSTAATVTGTVAWFSMNKTVTASGLVVKAQAEGSLVIKQREKTSPKLPDETLKATDFNFHDTSGTAIYASTHDQTYATGLKYCTNAEVINPETGTRNDGNADALTYETAENGSKNYYKDYEVYIAGDGQSFTGKNITVSIDCSSQDELAVNKATSVDFYIADTTDATTTMGISSSTFLGTLNWAGKKNNVPSAGQESTYTTAQTSLVISGHDIPKADGTAALHVLMRVYYDGALIEVGGSSGYTAYAQYIDVAAEEAPVNTTYYYTKTDHKVSVVAKNVGQTGGTTASDISGLCKVDKTKSVVTYASSNEYGDLKDVTIKATFELE